MLRISIIGSDSFIATHFYNSLPHKEKVKLFSRQCSGKQGEIIINDFFHITSSDFVNSEVLINFAAIVHQPKLKNIALYKRVNTDLPIYLAKQAKKAGIKHFIQMSSIAIYGHVSQINESTPELPTNLYGKSKLDADNVLLSLQNDNFKVSIIRPPMVYGGGKAPGNMQKLIQFAHKGIPLPFKGVVNERDFIHIYNLVQVLNTIVEIKINKRVIIPTDRQSVSTEKLIKLIKTHSSQNIRQITIPRIFHILLKKSIPSVYSKLFGTLKVKCNLSKDIYNPHFSIEAGIKEMIEAIEKKNGVI